MILKRDLPTKREVSAQKTKETLFSTAIKLITDYGFDVTTVEDITRIAGVSKGTFYTHFDSKDAVLVELFRRIDQHYLDVFENVSPTTKAADRLMVLIDAMCDYCSNVCGLAVMRVVYMNQISTNASQKFLANDQRVLYALMGDIVRQGFADGDFVIAMEEQKLRDLLVSFARINIYDWCLHDGEYDLRERGQEYFRWVIDWMSNTTKVCE